MTSEVERIAELEDDGYFESIRECPECGGDFMVKITRKPFRRESDVIIVRFHYVCPFCGYSILERDSD